MRRTIPLLAGLAILGVVLNHSNWHILARYSPGETAGYLYLAIDQVGKFAIVAFVFIAGYFISYATNAGKRDLPKGTIIGRLQTLLWPWLIWSLIMWVGQYFLGEPLSWQEFLRAMFVQYYFIPLLYCFYLLAPLTVRWAKTNPFSLLLAAGGIQLAAVLLFYLRVYLPAFPENWQVFIDIGLLQYLRFAFYFPLGYLAGVYSQPVKKALEKHKGLILGGLGITLLLSVLEAAYPYQLGGGYWPVGGDQTKFTSALFSINLFLCFMAFDRINLPFNNWWVKLGNRSCGIFLSHYIVLGLVGRLLRQIFPWLMSWGWLYVPLAVTITLGVVMLGMDLVSRLPTKKAYRYLFG